MGDNKKNEDRDESLNSAVRLAIHEEVEQRVEKRVEKVEEQYKRQAKTLIGAIVIIGGVLGISGWTAYKAQLRNFLDSTEGASKTKEIRDSYNEATNTLNQLRTSSVEYNNRLAELKKIDGIITSTDLKANLSSLEPKFQAINRLLADSQKAYAESQKALQHVKEETDYHFSAADAGTGSKAAFDKLQAIASNTNNSYFDKAKISVSKVIKSMTNISHASYQNSWKKSNVLEKISFDEAVKDFENPTNSSMPFVIVTFIGKTPRFSKPQRFQFLSRVYQETDNLRAIYAAEVQIQTLARDPTLTNLPPFSFEQINKWLTENRSKFSD